MTADALIGRQLDEYRVEAVLGQGGMARVYLGRDMRVGRPVAIKVIDLPYRTDSEYVERFEREARAIGQLEHSNIVRLYRFGDALGLLYMAMQYIDGPDLHHVLAEAQAAGHWMPADAVAQLVTDLAAALDYAHAQGIIHRDLKPSNVLLDRSGRAVLTDFGLALLAVVGTRGKAFGSPHYMAPEQALSSAGAVPQSDVYSLAVMAYEMLAGRPPYEAEAPLDVALKHVNEPLPSPRLYRPELGREVEQVLVRALAKHPEDRYPNAAALARALSQALLAGGLIAEPTRPGRVPATLAQLAQAAPAAAALGAAPPMPPPAAPAAAAGAPAPAGPAPAGPVFVAGPRGRPANRRQQWACAGCLGLAVLAALLAGSVWRLLAAGIAPQPASRTQAPTPSATASPRPSATLAPTDEPAPTATAEPGPVSEGPAVNLWLVKRGKDELVVVNEGAERLSLAGLVLTGARGQEAGEDGWEAEWLEPDECLLLVEKRKDDDDEQRARLPDDKRCDLAAEPLAVGKLDRFWTPRLTVTYNGVVVGECARNDSSCHLSWPGDE